LFVREYLTDLNATKAAIRAGYSAETAYAIGAENLRKPHISVSIEQLIAERTRRLDITGEKVLQGLAEIAFANMYDFIEITADGQAHVELSGVDRTSAGAIVEVTTDTIQHEGQELVRTRLKLGNKIAALVALAKYLRLGGSTVERGIPPVEFIITGAGSTHAP
jgi:phage terminase small subunit